jgi:hypothetical protein
VPAGDADALAQAATARYADTAAGDADLARVRAAAAPEVVTARLVAAYTVDA